MRVALNEIGQVSLSPVKEEIKKELELREGNKEYVYNLTPFVRLSCLQKVSYEEQTDDSKKNNLRGIGDSILTGQNTFNGFQFTFESDFEESYGEVQKIGKTLDNEDVRIKNPRRVPPPTLNSFNAQVGENSDWYAEGTISFTCNSLEQLQFLVPFLFNPGNVVFVEFGHNTEKLKNQISSFGLNDAEMLTDSIVNTDSNFIQHFEKRVLESGGAYEYLYGMVHDFTFELNESLGYDCTISLFAIPKAESLSENSADNDGVTDNDADDVSELEVNVRSLQSKLKLLENELDRLDDEVQSEKDDVFSFSDNDSYKYIRFKRILDFFNNNYLSSMIRDQKQRENRRNPYRGYYSDPSNDIQLSNSLDNKEKPKGNFILNTDILVNKARVDLGEPPVVSYDDDVLIFRNHMWTPEIEYNNDGSYSIKNVMNYKINKGLIAKSSISMDDGGLPYVKDILSADVNFKIANPHTVDHPDEKFKELLTNIYINYQKFRSIFISAEGRTFDVIKRLVELINEATNNRWKLKFVGDTVIQSPESSDDEVDEETNSKGATVVSETSMGIDYSRNSYTFKANSKDSVFTSMAYSFDASDTYSNVIYMNAIGSPDGSNEAGEFNLTLFSNHENGITVSDMWQEKQRAASDDSGGKGGGERGTDNNDDNVNKQMKFDEIRKNFFGIPVIGNSGNGNGSNVEFENILTAGSKNYFRNNTLNTVSDFNMFYSDDHEFNYSNSNVIKNILEYYDVELVPLTFAPIKDVIERLRVKTNPLFKPNKTDSDDESSDNNVDGRSDRGLNPMIETTFDITLPGISGINPNEYVNLSGIPDVYANRADYAVMNVSHTVTPTSWQTEISTRMRPKVDDE